jgi:hypothetical protein
MCGHPNLANRRSIMNIAIRLMSLGLLLAGLVSSASAAFVSTQCGGAVRNTTKTATATFTFSSQGFVDVPNGSFTVQVPPGKQLCVTVTFSASSSCPLGCLMRVLAAETGMHPLADVTLANGNSDEVHSFQWVKRLAAGTHIIKAQIRTANNTQNATIGPYTTSLDVAE